MNDGEAAGGDLTQSLLRATLEATADGILVVGSDGTWRDFNRKFVAMWRIPPAIVEARDDRRALDFVLDQLADPQAFIRKVQDLYAHPKAESFDLIEFKDRRLFERYSTPLTVDDHVAGRVWSFRDVTERVRAEREAERLYRASLEAVRLRDEFLAVASHELRTPVTSLQLAVQGLLMLFDDERTPPRDLLRQLSESTLRQTRRLGRLVEDLLDVSRIQGGRLELRREEMDLVEAAREAAASMRDLLSGAGCALTVEAEAPVVGRWDRQRIEQVVVNLLANAAKYGPHKPVRVTVAGKGGWARLAVEDSGIGIAPERHGELFERFARAASALHYGGLGLGLFIVRSIVEAHGGRVGVDSAVGAGARFTVELPLSCE